MQPMLQARVPSPVRRNTERFQVPAVMAVMLFGQFRPNGGHLLCIAVAQREGAFAQGDFLARIKKLEEGKP